MTHSEVMPYAGAPLDRAGNLRDAPAWMGQQCAHPQARVLALRGGQVPVASGGNVAPQLLYVPLNAIASSDLQYAPIFLGLDGTVPVFAVAVDEVRAERLAAEASASYVDLRRASALLSADALAICAHARALLHWHDHARHCGRCGAPTEPRRGGHARICTNAACARETFPRTDPAVIMLVTRPTSANTPSACLLGRHAGFAPGMYSTLAGFVEPGETLEEAVRREVFEEAGVSVGTVTYDGSQPWPYPSSLMIGFFAEALDDAIEIDRTELEDARWFTADEVRAFADGAEGPSPFRLPGRLSIARRLVETWLAREGSRDV